MVGEASNNRRRPPAFISILSSITSASGRYAPLVWLGISAAFGTLLTFIGGGFSKEGAVFQGVASAFLFFIAEHIIETSAYAKQGKDLHEEQNQNLLNVIDRLRISDKVLLPLRYSRLPAFEAYSETISNFLKEIIITDQKIFVKGENISRELYQNFWKRIIEEQRLASVNGRPDLKVYLTHSSSILSWKREDFWYIKKQQDDFLKIGGRIYRIFLHNPDLSESCVDYCDVIERMRRKGVNAYYVNIKNHHRLRDQDFTMVKFSDEFYFMQWYTDVAEAFSTGKVISCNIDIGEKEFVEKHWGTWQSIFDAMMDTPFDGDCEAEELESIEISRVLSVRPEEGSVEYSDMTDLS